MPKKAASKKFDPEQVFVIQSMTRKEIAEAVNGVIQNESWDIPKLTDNDPRLTDDFCESYTECLDSGICDVDDVVDAQYQYEREFVRSEFGDKENG